MLPVKKGDPKFEKKTNIFLKQEFTKFDYFISGYMLVLSALQKNAMEAEHQTRWKTLQETKTTIPFMDYMWMNELGLCRTAAIYC